MGRVERMVKDGLVSDREPHTRTPVVVPSASAENHVTTDERDNGTAVRKYYYAGAVRVAMRTGGNTYYLLNDHPSTMLRTSLTSTAITTNSSGIRQTELRYFAYEGTRYDAGGQMTLYRYTGQRVESGTGLYDYGARWYDPAIGRFLAADSIVPNPGDSQSLNRYMYVLGNPVKYSDPSGHAACGADDRACWENEWTWKNRWYNAHGYFHDGNHWGQQGDAVFSDTGIIQEVLAEAGIRFSDIHRWSLQEMTPVTQGVVRFGQRLSRGLPGLKELLGGWVVFSKTHNLGCFTGGACSLPPGTHHVAFTSAFLKNSSTEYIAQTTVHELAHVIDWQGHFSKTWSGTPLTDYATCASFQCLSSTWETWAEAVTVWVYGAFDVTTGHFATMYKSNEVRSHVVQNRLNEQMLAVQTLLGGWR
jgi:RHS repeat-associated protein